jgi:DSF synthase
MLDNGSLVADNLVELPNALVQTAFDPHVSTLWITMATQRSRPQNFSRSLLRTLNELLAQLDRDEGLWRDGSSTYPVDYAVLSSGHRDYFSVGGDLAHFQDCIHRRDIEALRDYSTLCLDMMYNFATRIPRRTTTIALVQGRALGGGFETALSANYIIAEEHAEFGLPEIMFGLFPCTGALSLLASRVGLRQAEAMVISGRIYSAAELHDLGVVDAVCPTGAGRSAAATFIDEHSKRQKARAAVRKARQRMDPLDYGELTAVVTDWVDTAMRLTDNELRVLDTLIRMQRADMAH